MDSAAGLRKTNLMARYALGTAADGLTLGLTHYASRWISTDQVPQRAIDAGQLGRFRLAGRHRRGQTRRIGVNAAWSQQAGVSARR